MAALSDLIIYDFVAYWVPPIATKLSIPCFFYNIFSVGATCIYASILERAVRTGKLMPEDVIRVDYFNFPSAVRHKQNEAVRLCRNVVQNASGVSDAERMESAIRGCQSLLVRTCVKFEGEYVAALQEFYRKPVIPVGLLPPVVEEDQASKPSNPELVSCFRWLDQQAPRSVVFVAFGTEARLSKEEIEAIAAWLELSDQPFCWILRRPSHVSASSAAAGGDGKEEDADDPLPRGFRDRTAERGFISMSWVPQEKVLAHGSIGACLYHSAMSSTMEALQFGLPLENIVCCELQFAFRRKDDFSFFSILPFQGRILFSSLFNPTFSLPYIFLSTGFFAIHAVVNRERERESLQLMMDEKQCHIVMVPWLAFGHMIPFLELSNALAAQGVKVSFLCTPRNIEKLRPKIPSHLASRIDLLRFPLPAVAGLLENAEATADLEQDTVQYLKKVYDELTGGH